MEHFIWRKSNNVISDTVILTESLSRTTSREQVRSLFDSVAMKVSFANDLNEALAEIGKADEMTK